MTQADALAASIDNEVGIMIPTLALPNNLNAGLNVGKDIEVDAIVVTDALFNPLIGQVDRYRFYLNGGSFRYLTAELVSFADRNILSTYCEMELYLEEETDDGLLLVTPIALNIKEFETFDPILLDVPITTSGTYRLEVRGDRFASNINRPGEYKLLVYAYEQPLITLELNSLIQGSTRGLNADANFPECVDNEEADDTRPTPGMTYMLVGTGDDIALSICTQDSEASTGSANFDTVITVYEEVCEGELKCIARNDDFKDCGVGSWVTFESEEEQTYFVRVSGYAGILVSEPQFELPFFGDFYLATKGESKTGKTGKSKKGGKKRRTCDKKGKKGKTGKGKKGSYDYYAGYDEEEDTPDGRWRKLRRV